MLKMSSAKSTISENPKVTVLAFLGRHGAFLGHISRTCPTLSRRPLWRCICAAMVSSSFVRSEAPQRRGSMIPPPPRMLSKGSVPTSQNPVRTRAWRGFSIAGALHALLLHAMCERSSSGTRGRAYVHQFRHREGRRLSVPPGMGVD